ncbi:MAG: porin family protein [Paludibacter sp.]|nr:porin family protein [Paludibacter sp.]
MKQILLGILVLITNVLLAQEKEKGDLIIGFSTGSSFSNLLNSEAPHKINIFGSDVNPVGFYSSDLTESPAYIDYETGIFRDVLFGVTSSVQIEYFIKNNLSLSSGISYEPKGINLNYSNTVTDYYTTAEILTLKIKNDYLVIPICLKKYVLKKKNIFVSGGMYFGYLLSSRIDYLNKKTVSDESGILSNYSTWIDNEKDKKREYTNKFDFGFSLGTGYVKNISNRLIFKSEFLFNIGLRKVDAKYNNDYSVKPIPMSSDFGNYLVRSTNYYGLNSNSKNINLLIKVGLGYKIGK